ncbi:MAG: hypothetical protein ABS46_11995 [Cytophagaceae bacterium SCN 52-12]|nr:MAG: hypothetical protein ABS46_11995 [Cytophagaceae bacterium SCN 52-12]
MSSAVAGAVLLWLTAVFSGEAKSQSFEKCEKQLSAVLPEFNRAFGENDPAILKQGRYLKKLNALRRAYAGYHASSYLAEDSVARIHNEAVLLALSGLHYKALQQITSVNGGAERGLVAYHRGLIYLLAGDFAGAARELGNTGQPNAALNAMVASGRLAGQSGMTGFPGNTSGLPDPDGKLSYNRGVLLSRAGDKQGAVTSFTAAIVQNDQPAYRMARGDALAAAGKPDAARTDFKMLAGKHPKAMVRLGHTLVRLGAFAQARQAFRAYLKTKDNSFRNEAFLGLANAFYGEEAYAEARKYYEMLASYKPLAAAGQQGIGNVALAERRYGKAKAIFDGLISRDPAGSGHAYLGRAVARYGLGDYHGALADFSQADTLIDVSRKEMADILVCRGYSNYFVGRIDAAAADFGQAAELDAGRYEALAGLGKIEIDRRRYAEAGKFLNAALSYEKTYDRLWTNYGNLLMHFGMYEKAFAVFATAVKLNPVSLNAQNGRGITLLEQDMLEEARSLFDSLVRTNRGQPFLLNNRGIVNAYIGNRFSQYGEQKSADRSYKLAERDFNLALETSPAKKFYHVNKGNVFRYWEQYEDARTSYQSYQDKSALNNTAVMYAGLERLKDARYYMGVALQLDSTHRAFRYNMNMLARDGGRAKEMSRFVASARDSGPYSEISLKYSLDGYVTLYLYDYEYENMLFPGRHHLPAPLKEIAEDYLIPEFDFRLLPYAEKKADVSRKKAVRSPRIKLKGRARSGTKCPVLF